MYKLHTTREENDQRIQALHVEMKEMMKVLLQLVIENGKDFRSFTHRYSRLEDIGPSDVGGPIEDELKDDIENARKDMEECENACDTYSKKRRLVKFFTSPSWEAKFAQFVAAFTEHRETFNRILIKRIAKATNSIQKDVKDIKTIAQESSDRFVASAATFLVM